MKSHSSLNIRLQEEKVTLQWKNHIKENPVHNVYLNLIDPFGPPDFEA